MLKKKVMKATLVIISEVKMEQLLSQLGESLSVGEMGELGEGGGEELPREVVQVEQNFLDCGQLCRMATNADKCGQWWTNVDN